MLRNHIFVALRGVRRRPGYAAINVFGLALGVACCLLIFHHVQDELAYDRFHEKGDRIARIVTDGEFAAVSWPVGRILEEEYPEVERVTYMRSWPTFPLLHQGERLYERMLYADEAFFEVFDFALVEGDPGRALQAPHAAVISEGLASRLFGDGPAVGATLTLGDTTRVAVSGVVRVPRQSHMQFDVLLSMQTLRAMMGPADFDEQMSSGWGNVNMITYVLLREGTDRAAFAELVRNLPRERVGEMLDAAGWSMFLGLEPLRSIYLRSPLGSGVGPSGSIATVRLLSLVALFILLLAAVNFVNLATARSMERAREVGVRKALGAGRPMLVRQFLSESTLMALVAVASGVVVAWVALPYFGELSARSYAVADLANSTVLLGAAGLVAVIGLLAGLYPAVALSRFRPVEVLRGRFSRSGRGVRLRQGLVVLQFAITSVLLIATLVVLGQLRYMQSEHPGFDREQILVVDAQRAPAARRAVLRETLEGHAGVQRVAAAAAVPGRAGWRGQMSYPESLPDGQSVSLEYIPVDHEYVPTLGLELVAGRNFSPEIASDAENAVIVNEAAVQAAGWASPADAVGRRYASPGSGKPEGVVVGVVRDHHHHGLRERIEPIMYGINSWALGLLAVRIEAGQSASVIAHLEAAWKEQLAGYPYSHAFLDEAFAAQYEDERRLARIFGTFALLAVLIGCLGLLGLAAFTAGQRRAEVGVRKVLGATVPQLVGLLSRDFMALVGVALVVAVPVAYVTMGRWLEGFAYRIELGPGVFVLAAAAAALAALVTVAGQSLRAATADPVEAIRAEG